MARTGNFGRAPRSAPSLTNTIVAIAREFQQQRDQNIMDAWYKGGTFEGRKVTDDLVLKHWRERMNGVSKDDPLYDTYKNAVTNLDYTIHESKMTAAYALKQKSDSEMVAFYLGWAKKVPKNSEFYRVLQRDAGQYMRSAKQRSEADIAAAKEARYQKQQGETQKKYEAAGEFIVDTLRRMNQSGWTSSSNSVIPPTLDSPDASATGRTSNTDLTDFDPNDPEVAMKLLAIIAPYKSETTEVAPGVTMPTGGAYEPNAAVLYHSDRKVKGKDGAQFGRPVTGADVVAELAKLDPSYKPGQPIDIAYITGLLDRQGEGLQERIDRAIKTGHMQDANNLQKSRTYIAALNRQVAAWPIEKAYSDIRQTFDAVANDPTASPQAVMKAWETYKAGLVSLAGDSRIATNDNMRARILAEANGETGVPTLNESFTGYDGTNTDSANLKGLIEFNQSQIDAVAKSAALPDGDPNKVTWTYGTTSNDGVFHPDPNGTEVGAAPMSAIAASGVMPQTVTIDDPRGSGSLTMVVTAVPVYGTAKDPLTDDAIPTENNQPIAYAYNFPNGGQNSLQYGYLVKDPADPSKSVMNFSNESNPPWNENLGVTPSSDGGNHYEVDFTPLIPTTPLETGAPGTVGLGVDLTKAGGVEGLPGFTVQDVGKPSASNPAPTGVLTFDPYAVARASDTGRNALGGTDPTTDFTSLTVSNLMSTVDGRGIMTSLDQHPAFSAQVTKDINTYAGVQQDPKTGAWLPETGDPTKMAQAEGQANMAKNAKTFVDFLTQGAQTWQRLTTGSPYPASTGVQPSSTGTGQQVFGQQVEKLATDLVKGTPFEPIASVLLSGTLTKKPVEQQSTQEFVINTGTGFKVPAYEPKKVVTNQTTTTTGPGGGGTSAQQTGPTGQQQQTNTQTYYKPTPTNRAL